MAITAGVGADIRRVVGRIPFVDRSRVQMDLEAASHVGPYLKFTETDYFDCTTGTATRCVSLNGVLSYMHKGNTYNCPVEVYVPQRYPSEPPIVYVRPTADMGYDRHAEYLQSDGAVMLPSISTWSSHSNVAQVLRDMSLIFGSRPPLRAKRKPQAASPAPTPAPMPAAYPSASPSPSPSRPPQPPAYVPSSSSASTSSMPDARELEAAKQLRGALAPRLREELRMWHEALCSALEEEEEKSATLAQALSAMEEEGGSADDKVGRLRAYVARVQEKKVLLDSWCDENEASAEDIDPEQAVRPAYPLHEQLLAAVAEASAVDDTIEVLKEALENNMITLKDLISEVRKLARHQYEAREVARHISNALATAAAAEPQHGGSLPGYPAASSGYSAPSSAGQPSAGFTMAQAAARW